MQTIVWRLDFFALVECRQTEPHWAIYFNQLAAHRSS